MNIAALILIDVQKGFDDPKWGRRNNPDAEANIAQLLSAWRAAELPVIHVQHHSKKADSPLSPGTVGCEFKPEAMPQNNEIVFVKHVNSAFIGTDLEAHLRGKGIETLVIVGLTTDHCVSTTTRMAGNLGFDTTLVSDATATFNRQGIDGGNLTADEIHKVNLASLNKQFCRVMPTTEVLATMLPNSCSRGRAEARRSTSE